MQQQNEFNQNEQFKMIAWKEGKSRIAHITWQNNSHPKIIKFQKLWQQGTFFIGNDAAQAERKNNNRRKKNKPTISQLIENFFLCDYWNDAPSLTSH